MAQYRAEILHPDVGYAEAVTRLNEMDDGELTTRLRPDMLAHHSILNHRAWQPEEPEHESLVETLRYQVRADLLAAYFGEQDYVADSQLAFSHTRPYPTLIYLTPFNEDEDEVDDFAVCNPVYRLICLGICKGSSDDNFDMTGNTADGYDALPTISTSAISIDTGNITYVPTSTTTGYTTSRPVTRRARPTVGASRGTATENWRYVLPEQENAMHWLNANADIARRQAAAIEEVRPRMSDLDVIDADELDSDDMRF